MGSHHLNSPLKIRGTSAAARQHRGYDIFLFDDLPPPSRTTGMEIRNPKFVTCHSFFTSPFLLFFQSIAQVFELVFVQATLTQNLNEWE